MNKTKQTILAILATMLAGCSVNIPPPDLYSDPDAISDVGSARSLLTSCYLLCPHYEFQLSLLGNDFCPTNLATKDANTLNFYRWQDKEISSFATDAWLGYYNTIANCDVLDERLVNVGTTTTEEEQAKKAITAECRTLKALCYFNLLRLFAPAYTGNGEADGIVLKQKVGIEMVGRSSMADCVAYIKGLLQEARESGVGSSSNGWLSAMAATYLLAELNLYCGNYSEAATMADEIIARCDDSQIANYGRLWETSSNSSRIFAFNTSSTYYTDIEYDTQQGDYYALNPALTLDEGDTRKRYNEYAMEMGGQTRTLFGKYNRLTKEGASVAYIDMMRYAGAYFISAEAHARMGESDKALSTINHYLACVGVAAISDSDNLTERILEAKYKEFAGEGSNYFDLKRTRTSPLPRLSTWGNSASTSIAADDYRWTFPIPSSEYKYNEAVTQNEGWPINRE